MSDAQSVSHPIVISDTPSLEAVPFASRAGLRRDPWFALAPLLVLAAISVLAYYFGFTRPFFLETYYQTPLLDLGKITLGTPTSANWWLLAWTTAFASYFLAFRLCPPGDTVSTKYRRMTLAIICLGGAVFSVALLFMYPVTAADLFDQIFRGRITSLYNLNTFLVPPGALGGDPFLPYVAWSGEGSPYGPIWEMLAAIPSKLAGDSLWNNIIYFKLLVIIFYGASTLIIYKTLRTLRPEWALRGALFFAWNPLVVFEVAGNGHNDAVLVTFVLLAIFLFVKGRNVWVLPALMAGVLTKFIPALLVPIALAALWRDRSATSAAFQGKSRWKSLATRHSPLVTIVVGGALALTLAVGAYLPFWQGTQTLGALNRGQLFTASIPTLSYLLFEVNLHISQEAAKELARTLAQYVAVFTVLTLTLFVFFKGRRRYAPSQARTPDERRKLLFLTFGAFYEIFFIYLAFSNLWFQPWYLIWLVAITPMVALYTNANRTILFCIGGIMNYYVWLYMWNWTGADGLQITIMAVLTVYFLPLLYTAYAGLKPLYERTWNRDVVEAPAKAGAVEVTQITEAEEVRQEPPIQGGTLLTRPARPKA